MKLTSWGSTQFLPTMRVIADNDFSGDPDGLIQLAHHLLSPAVEMRAIIASHLRADDHWNRTGDSVTAGVDGIHELLEVMKMKSPAPILRGSDGPLINHVTPMDSEGARFIIKEAMREDTNHPLYLVCGGSLTTIATAWLLEPRIASRITVLWIGGAEYPGQTPPPPGAPVCEYNLYEDLIAGQVVFNVSDLNIWHIPRDAYRQCNASLAELEIRMNRNGRLGTYLFGKIEEAVTLAIMASNRFAEVYTMGDSALVLLTALQNSFEPAPSSSRFIDIPRLTISDDGSYGGVAGKNLIRVFTHLDVRLMQEDLYAKLEIHSIS
jgi:purine nucleosidase